MIKRCTFYFVLLILFSCKKPYNPGAISTSQHYLVVEGFINSGDSTTFKLSRTVSLNSTVSSTPENGAIVTVEDDQSNSYPLNQVGSGTYTSVPLAIDNTRKYRLRIKTNDGNEYLSDLVQVKASPPIDSVGFQVAGNNLNIYVNTHDPSNATRYYRWDYQETWQFHSNYNSEYIIAGDTIIPRPPAQSIYYCFANDASSSVILTSTTKLSQDVVYQTPVTQISSTSEKIEVKYSILVRQYALTEDAFQFWQELEQNTEQIGSIFDTQPSSSIGNIHCISNPAEHVVGYISAGSISTKRIFITNAQVPFGWIAQSPYDCENQEAYFDDPNTHQNDVEAVLFSSGNYVITSAIIQNNAIVGYRYSSEECTNCTLRGAIQQPSFWK